MNRHTTAESGCRPAAPPAMSLFVGAATRDLSPAPGVQLAGYPHVIRRTTGVHDPLLASVLYLRDGSSGALLAALDLLMLNSVTARELRRRVAHAVELPEPCVLISCTHTHSGPVTLDYLPWHGDPAMPDPDPACLERMTAAVVEAAAQARNDARPAEIAWTAADARGVGGNRHDPRGPTDPEAGVLAIRAFGSWRAVVLVYGMHPTVLHEDSTLVSGDFPAFARQHIQEALGSSTTVLYHTGPAGDQSPRHCVQGQTLAEAERLGRQLGAAVLTRLGHLTFHKSVRLSGAIRAVALPRRTLPSCEEAERQLQAARACHEALRQAGAARAELRTAEVSVFGAEGALRLARARESGELDRFLAAAQPFEVQALRIGDICLAGIPGELFAEYGLQIKARAPLRTFPIAYANGELQGYIVTPQAAAAGGYEAAGSLFEPAAGERLVKEVLSAIDATLDEPPVPKT